MIIQVKRGKRHLFALETELEFVVVRTFGAVVVVFVKVTPPLLLLLLSFPALDLDDHELE